MAVENSSFIETGKPGRIVTILVDECDREHGAAALMLRSDTGSLLAYLTADQAMDVGSALCARGLTARDLPVIPEQEVADDLAFERARDMDRLGTGFTDGDSRRALHLAGGTFDAAEGQGRR